MKQLKVENSFWELFPEGQLNILTVCGVHNEVNEEQTAYFAKLLSDAKKAAWDHIELEPFTANPVIAQWREAYTKFKTKKGARSSIEALLKRVSQDRDFSPINPLVDIYNSVSLRYAVPCGGEDVEKLEGDLVLGKTEGNDAFRLIGSEEEAPTLPGEICYVDQAGAVCRCFNWREAERTMLTEQTTKAVLLIESVNAEQAERADLAIEELKTLVEDYFQVKATLYKVTKEAPNCPIE